MYKSILLLFSIFVSSLLFSQENDSTLIRKKNVIGINVSPIISGLTGGIVKNPFASIQYKRKMEKFNFRATGYYENSNYYDFANLYDITAINDSIIFTETTNSNSYTMDARFGLEWVKPSKKVDWIIGGDLIFGTRISDNTKSYQQKFYSIDSLGNFVIESPVYSSSIVNYTSRIKTRSYYFLTGLDLVLGMDFNLSKRFSISVQYTPKIIFLTGISQRIETFDSIGLGGSTFNNDLNFNLLDLGPYRLDVYLQFNF